jgi:Ca2+-binding RTX toxin-like protein
MARHVTVSNATELRNALNTRTADTVIVLKDGNFGEFSFNARDSHLGIRLVAADEKKPPVFNTLTITGANGVLVDGIHFSPKDGAKYQHGLALRNVDGATVVNSHFIGGQTGFDTAQRGLLVTNSTAVKVDSNEFTGLTRGAVFFESKGISLTKNSIHDMRSEGFNFAGVQDVVIGHNNFSNFHPRANDHADFIQFFTTGAKTATENVHIHDNTMMQNKAGLSVQGILIGNEKKIPHKNIVIEDNVIQTGMPNGIFVSTAEGVRIEDNVAMAVNGSKYKVSIHVTSSSDVLVEGNSSNGMSVRHSTDVTERDNVIIRDQVSGTVPVTDTKIDDLRSDSAIFNGTDRADRIDGKSSNDLINGGKGNDILLGRNGNDTLIGGEGNDILTGGNGADRFVFDAPSLSKTQSNRIMDLDFREGDSVELRGFSGNTYGKLGGVTVDAASKKSSFVIDSVSDLVALSKLEDVTFSRRGTTDLLTMRVQDADGDTVDILMSNMYKVYIQAGGTLI